MNILHDGTQTVNTDILQSANTPRQIPTTDQAKLERMIRHALAILRERQPAAPQTNEVQS
jgi:hypothetical protein